MDKVDSFTAKALKIHKALSKPVRFLIGCIADDEVDDSAELVFEETKT